ncbi:hypothetical protein HII31_01620 [Pseudocercospora fuligena]|uniref:Uncharacterized protein n=1 Tax=Pseudocercospora fuligena TaxID=685502 RepID=A0A8H6VSH3_9PEZI|nr:hypothetical protein HII31_01620 [Pseudocercospora fuligena]
MSRVALRYKNSNPEAVDPYLALYPTESTSSLWTGTGVSDILKGLQQDPKAKTLNNIDVSTFAAFGPRLYEKIQTYEAYGHENDTGKDRGQTVVCVAMEPGDEADFEDWYRKQHLDMLGMCKSYLRCTRYKRLDGQSPRYLALHEYACKPEDLPAEQIKQVVATEWSKKIIDEAKVFDRDVYELTYVVGNEDLKL